MRFQSASSSPMRRRATRNWRYTVVPWPVLLGALTGVAGTRASQRQGASRFRDWQVWGGHRPAPPQLSAMRNDLRTSTTPNTGNARTVRTGRTSPWRSVGIDEERMSYTISFLARRLDAVVGANRASVTLVQPMRSVCCSLCNRSRQRRLAKTVAVGCSYKTLRDAALDMKTAACGLHARVASRRRETTYARRRLYPHPQRLASAFQPPMGKDENFFGPPQRSAPTLKPTVLSLARAGDGPIGPWE